MPNWYRKRPEIDDMNETGRKITTSENVVASTASPMSAVAARAASKVSIFFSSTKRKMFSSTTIASSITIPTISTSASIVTLLSVKPKTRIMPNVATSEAGIATAAMSVARALRMNASTTSEARIEPSTRWTLISCSAFSM